MIPPRIQRVIECLARYEAIRQLKLASKQAEKLYNGAEFEEAEYKIVGEKRRSPVEHERAKKPRPRF